MKKIQKNAARFDNLKQDFLDDKKYSGTAEATLNGYHYTVSLELVQSASGKSPAFSTLHTLNVENSMVRPIDGLAPNSYNIIEIIIIQIILSKR